MFQHYIKLRAAIFAERGFCLNAPRLSKNRDAHFLMKDAAGATLGIDPVPGCSGAPDESDVVTLQPYPNPEKAHEALMLMVYSLEDALDGDHEAREALGKGWEHMIVYGCALVRQPESIKFELLKALLGEGRIVNAMNKGTLAFMDMPDMSEMLDEALPVI